MIVYGQDHEVSLTKDAHAIKAEALESSALIFKVDDSDSNERATHAQKQLQSVRTQIERARAAVKDPLTKLGRAIDRTAKEFLADVEEEESRIAALAGHYLETERMRSTAELQLQSAALDRLDREMNEKIACAETQERMDAVREEYSEKRRLIAMPIPETPRAKGQSAATNWEIAIVDVHELYRCHANCVDLKPRPGEIKALLNSGVHVRGIEATRSTKAAVRTRVPNQKPAIEA